MKKLFWKLMALDAGMRLGKIIVIEAIVYEFKPSGLKTKLMLALKKREDKLIERHAKYRDRYECYMPV